MHEVLVNRLGGLSLPRKSVVRLTDHPDMTLDVYRGRKTTTTLTIFIALSDKEFLCSENKPINPDPSYKMFGIVLEEKNLSNSQITYLFIWL